MSLRDRIVQQFALPTGFLGWLVGRRMARTTVLDNSLVLDELDVQLDDRILEIGFGPGLGIAGAAARASQGLVAGVDISPLMVRSARRRNREAVAAGTVGLLCGSMTALPYASACFDKVFTVNTIYFWSDPAACLAEMQRVLRPDGTLAVGFGARGQCPSCLRPPARSYAVDEVADLLREGGLRDVRVAERPMGERLRHCVSGRR